MGILSLIQREKNKFKNNASKEQVEGYRRQLVAGDIEVYDKDKKTIGGMIASAKAKLKKTTNRINTMKEEAGQKQNIKLKSKLENLRLKNKVAVQKEALQKRTGRVLRAVFGGVNVPTAQQKPGERGNMSMGGNPFPGSSSETPRTSVKKNVVQQEEGRNELGGRDPF